MVNVRIRFVFAEIFRSKVRCEINNKGTEIEKDERNNVKAPLKKKRVHNGFNTSKVTNRYIHLRGFFRKEKRNNSPPLGNCYRVFGTVIVIRGREKGKLDGWRSSRTVRRFF